ncbi:GumC family protein [Dyadobacter luticola]|uniref:Polysaccharide biosynthesis tyrosine autokinase n=1 Tax=Dyadobacter luticola TaxID=1979387 RepID=A0A5R9L5P6_9BACT|nr:tyrosine-protein kinase [Dyadobacter luticola]TLV03709.1 polysaccharide biosynthesis tyrosine autokinase [Dyadobacter luticola]
MNASQASSPAAAAPPPGGGKTDSIKAYISKCLYHWPLFVISAIIAAAGFYAFLQIIKPIYEVKASLIIKDEKKSPNDASPLHEIDVLNLSRIIENELEILKSKKLIGHVIDDLELDIHYQKVNQIGETDLYKTSPVHLTLLKATGDYKKAEVSIVVKDSNTFFVQMPSDSLQEFSFGQELTNSFGTWKLEPEKNLDAFKGATIKIFIFDPEALAIQYQNKIRADLSNKFSTTVVLGLEDTDPNRGKDILNRLIYNYSLAGAQEKNRKAKSTIDFINTRLDSLSRELGKAEKGIETFKSSKGLTDISAASKISLENMQSNDAKLNEVNVQLSVIEGIERYINSSQTLGKAPATLGIEDPALSNLIEKLAQLQLNREQLLATTPETNPDFEAINRQIATTKGAIRENVENIRASLLNTQRQLMSYNTRFETLIRDIPVQERQYISIKREQATKESLYNYLNQKREELSVSHANTLAEDRIVDDAYAGPPKNKAKMLGFIAALAFALALPAGLILLRTILSPKITDVQEIKDSLGLPILGELTFHNSNDPIAVTDFSSTVIGEQFRALRIQLHYLFDEKEHGRVTLVTSSVSGEGKSFVSSNLGIALALSGRKTIILELDLRKPKIRETLNLTGMHAGMSDFLRGESPQSEVIQSSGIDPNLDVISSGSEVLNPSELLESKYLKILIENLRGTYDDIIIDSPPLHLVPDAMILSRLSDITLYMVRQGFTQKSELDFISDLNYKKRLFNINIVFNGVHRQKYGYGYDYDRSYYHKTKSGLGSLFYDFTDRF